MRFLRPWQFFLALLIAAPVLVAQTAGTPQAPDISSADLQPSGPQLYASTSALPGDPSAGLALADPVSGSGTAQLALQSPLGRQPSPEDPAPMDTSATVRPSHYLTLSERFRLQAHTTFGPEAVVFPAIEAGYGMAHPPPGYPRDWSDGGGAFARNYGSILGGRTAGGLTDFAVAWVDHEDPRYFRDLDPRATRRISHALLFTFFDRANSGHRTLALSNFAAAGASGFVCNLWGPDGFNDNTHALQRSELAFAALAAGNLVAEFSPELSKLMHKMHLPDRMANSVLPLSY